MSWFKKECNITCDLHSVDDLMSSPPVDVIKLKPVVLLRQPDPFHHTRSEEWEKTIVTLAQNSTGRKKFIVLRFTGGM